MLQPDVRLGSLVARIGRELVAAVDGDAAVVRVDLEARGSGIDDALAPAVLRA